MCIRACGAAPVYFMAQEAPQASVARSSSTSPTRMWESHQVRAPLAASPSWSSYAGALLADSAAFGADSSSSSDMRLASEHAHGHVWSHGQGALSTEHFSGSNGYRENFLDLLASRNVTPELFDDDVPAACNYLKGMDGSSSAYGLGCSDSHRAPSKYELGSSPLYFGNSAAQGSTGCMPCYGNNEAKQGNQQQEFGAQFLQQIVPNTVGIHSALDYSTMGTPFDRRGLPDFGSFSGYRSTAELISTKPYMRCVDLSDSSNRQEQEVLSARNSSIGSGSGAASDPRKRKSEERLEGTVKKSKQEAANTPPVKVQAPKVKLGEKITALQQIVSPFGKTDTASVLFETIKYIKCLHEQIQLFSEPYTKTSTNKGHMLRGGEEATEKMQVGMEHDLKGRGLCLVPVSWTPQVYRDNSGPDYWTPAYRSCLYR